jgi:hypothetical protein
MGFTKVDSQIISLHPSYKKNIRKYPFESDLSPYAAACHIGTEYTLHNLC